MKWINKLYAAKIIAFTQFGIGSELQWIIASNYIRFISDFDHTSVQPGSFLLGFELWQCKAIEDSPGPDTIIASIESPGSCISVQVHFDGTIAIKDYA